jgi:hypothetical protein
MAVVAELVPATEISDLVTTVIPEVLDAVTGILPVLIPVALTFIGIKVVVGFVRKGGSSMRA